MTDIEIPEAMVEAAAMTLADFDGKRYLFVGRYPSREDVREAYRVRARDVLEDALATCHLREVQLVCPDDLNHDGPCNLSRRIVITLPDIPANSPSSTAGESKE